MREHIVVAVDGGPASEAAVRWVAERAKWHELEVDVTTVVDGRHHDPEVRTRQYEYLHETRDTLASLATSARVSERTLLGDPVEELTLASRDADLVVVGTKRTSGLASLLHSTVPLALAGQTACPMVVVPASWTLVRGGPVVVGWQDDGSANEAVDIAATEAAAAGCELYLIHSWTMPPVNAFDPAGSAELYQLVQSTQRELLDGAARRVQQTHPNLTVRSGLTAYPVDTTLGRMGEHASLLVIGSHGRGAISDLIVGSVGDDLIRAMTCPVMIVPPRPVEPIAIYPELVEEDV